MSGQRVATTAGGALQISLFDPQGRTQPLLERFGCKVKMLPAISPEALADCRVLMISPNAVIGRMASEQEAIKQFTQAGGRVLVLDQTEMGILPGDVFMEKAKLHQSGFRPRIQPPPCARSAGHGLRDVEPRPPYR